MSEPPSDSPRNDHDPGECDACDLLREQWRAWFDEDDDAALSDQLDSAGG